MASIFDLFGGQPETPVPVAAPGASSLPVMDNEITHKGTGLFSVDGFSDFLGTIANASKNVLDTGLDIAEDFYTSKNLLSELKSGISAGAIQPTESVTPYYGSWDNPAKNDKIILFGAIGIAGLAILGFALK